MAAPNALRLLRAPGVRLVAPEDGDGPKWIQIAREGEWNGHPMGAFTFDAAVFDELIANFRANPSYQAGPDGVGCCDVIAFDFHHASEAPATAVAVQGSPAQAWAQELEKRTGADGKLELWALTRFLEPMRSYAREGRYKWTSVAVYLDAVDPVSGEPCGAYLSSIAFTNDPFIQGMEPIAATRSGAPRKLEYTEEMLENAWREVRWIFGLDDLEGVDVARAKLAQVRAYLTGAQEAPAGVEADDFAAKLRGLLGLPLLATVEEILAGAETLLGAIAASEMITTKRTSMHEKLIPLLAARFNIPTDPDGVSKRILAELDGAAQAQALLGAICKALGIEDSAGAVQRITSMMQQSAELEALMPQLAALKDQQAKSEDQAAETDVEDVMASRKLPAEVKASLLFTRKGGIALDAKSKTFEADMKRREQARDDFRKLYPLPGKGKEHLLESLATRATSTQSSVLRALELAPDGRSVRAPDAAPGKVHAGGAVADQVRLAAGRNPIEKAMSYLRGQAGGKELSYEQCHEQACLLVRSLGGERAIAAA